MKSSSSPTSHQSTSGPLCDIRILDLSRLVAGNMLTHVLADLGAEVIKIERPGVGDDLRQWRVQDHSTHWMVYARNKKSLTLNIKHTRGREILLALAKHSQVLVENFVPGTLERWQLGPDELLEANPNLIIARISGWGQSGPYRDKPGFGSLVEAMSGFAAMTGFADRPPVLPPLALADMIAGLSGAMAVLAALRAHEQGGQSGQVIDVSLFEPILSVLGPLALNYQLTGQVPQRMGSRTDITAPRNVYQCNDGRYVALSASMQAMVERLFQAIGQSDLINDGRFKTNTDRVNNSDVLDSIIAEFMAQRSQQQCLDIFNAAGVTVGPVCDIEQLINHPYVRERQALVDVPDTILGNISMHNVTPRLSATPGAIHSPAPSLGQHNEALLAELGYDAVAIEELVRSEII